MRLPIANLIPRPGSRSLSYRVEIRMPPNLRSTGGPVHVFSLVSTGAARRLG